MVAGLEAIDEGGGDDLSAAGHGAELVLFEASDGLRGEGLRGEVDKAGTRAVEADDHVGDGGQVEAAVRPNAEGW